MADLRFGVSLAPVAADLDGVLALAAASLNLLSRGRFELGLGAGASQRAVSAMGGPSRGAGEAVTAAEESIRVIRAMWRAGQTVRKGGQHYPVQGVHAGPAPAHDIGIWLGSVGPRSLNLTGRLADGCAAPIPAYLPYEDRPAALAAIDAGAREAGRDPGEVLRIAQLVGPSPRPRPASPPPPPACGATRRSRPVLSSGPS